ncbi:MAG TPA: glycosyltransferase, partial [Limnobacter sp.]|nr:glycosyltransferase [Limnobacter sp.]
AEQTASFLELAKPILDHRDWLAVQKDFVPNPQSPASQLPWLARLIYAARVDLRQKMDIATPQGFWLFCAWLVRSAVNANKALCIDLEFLNFCAQTKWPSTGLNLVEAVIYQASPKFASDFPLPTGESDFLKWLSINRGQPLLAGYNQLLDAIDQRHACGQPFRQLWPSNATQAQRLPTGFNVIGYVQTQSGIGEDARTTFDALRAQGHACALIDFKPGDPLPQNVHSHDQHLTPVGPYASNVICLPATELVRYAVTGGLSQMAGRYNIGYWPWELNGWPKPWQLIDTLVDEVWVASRFIQSSISPSVSKPVRVVPLHVELGPVSPLTRADFGLPESAKLFCFAFDLNSSIHRKNPHDCLRIFLESFPREQGWTKSDVGLVIKTHKPAAPSEEWDRLKTLAAADDRIHIFEQSFFKPDLLALYNVCDCFLSLHRAEGYGRSIAEAILLGLEVVTTGYSGNLDFCHPPQCTLVDCELVPVQANQYPDGEGLQWAGNLKLPKLDAVRRRFVKETTHKPQAG